MIDASTIASERRTLAKRLRARGSHEPRLVRPAARRLGVRGAHCRGRTRAPRATGAPANGPGRGGSFDRRGRRRGRHGRTHGGAGRTLAAFSRGGDAPPSRSGRAADARSRRVPRGAAPRRGSWSASGKGRCARGGYRRGCLDGGRAKRPRARQGGADAARGSLARGLWPRGVAKEKPITGSTSSGPDSSGGDSAAGPTPRTLVASAGRSRLHLDRALGGRRAIGCPRNDRGAADGGRGCPQVGRRSML